MNFRDKVLTFPPNRVWRSYPGGRLLDTLAGRAEPADTHFPEDWIGSVTRARNPGREGVEEGISRVRVGETERPFDALLAADPEYFLGSGHVAAFGSRPQLLVKLLDSAVRLHFQCHPTAAFARERMGEPSGKAEAYHILALREGVRNPYVHVGFQHPPDPVALKRWIEEQDLERIESCFEKIPVKQGDTLFIPGGFPHAIGEGILMVEIMEPSDLAIRFEFEKAGYTLPESARFMGRGLDFCLEAFDFSTVPVGQVQERYFFEPRRVKDFPGDGGSLYQLIGPETTPCMEVGKAVIRGPVLRREDRCLIGIVTKGKALVEAALDRRELGPFDAFFLPAGGSGLRISPLDDPVEILECCPPRP